MPAVSAHEHRPPARSLALLCSTALSGTVAISCIVSGLGAGTGAASAGEFAANDDASLRQAIQDANSDIDSTSTITLTDNITLDPATLPTIGRSITIDTDGFMLKAQDGDIPGGNGRTLTFPVDSGGAVQIKVVGSGHINGGDGANGAGGAAGANGGDGGGGGDGLHIDSLQSLEIADGFVEGGDAGWGGAAGAGGNGGNGGIGGNGIWLGSGDLINSGRIYGQIGSIGTGGVIGGDGGNGGNGVVLGSGTLTNNNVISAGTAAGAGAGDDSGGNGGVGGIGVVLGSGTLINNGMIEGNTGGTGGTGFSGDGGVGGAGGAGVTIDDGQLTNHGTITGGLGGNGGDSRSASGGIAGDGGTGGIGVLFSAQSDGVVVDANVTGGAGGNGGNGLGPDSSDAFGGAGGAGIVFGGGGSITVSAAVAGGNGGKGGSADVALGGAGGVGIEGAGLTIAMGATGSVSGGMGAGAASNGFAVNLMGGSNVIDLSGATSQMTGDINVAAGDLEFVTSGDATIANVISGGGSMLFDSAGRTLTLSGTNTYTGGTQLLGGVLSVSSDANLGGASGALTFDGGALRNTAALATVRDVTLDAGGGTFQAGDNLALNGVISGAGSLTKAGTGILTLSNANSYSGGTTISQGRLTAAVTGALGTGPVDVVTGGNLAFIGAASAGSLDMTLDTATIRFDDNASAGTATIANTQGYINFYDTAAAGSATIVNEFGGTSFNAASSAGNADITAKNYGTIDFYDNATAGTALLTSMTGGLIRFHGDTTADDATILGKAGGWIDISDLTSSGIGIGSLSGDGEVALGSKVLTVGGLGKNDVIGGTIADGTDGTGGSLVKIGAGTLTLNGMNTYTGLTTINDGKLVVGDDSHATASLAGNVLVDSGGTLGGIGTVGSTTVASGGTVAPGNSIGTLTVKGDITFEAGSTYLAEINPALDSDLIDASGKATIKGGTIYAAKAGGVYTPGSRWTIIGAKSGVTGTFDPTVAQNMPFVDLALAYDATHVYIDATRNAVAFCDVAMTFNQCSTGDGLESLGADNSLYDIVAALPDEGSARAALDALSGETYASTKSALIEDSHFVRDAVNDRVRSAFGDLSAPSMPVLAYGEGGPRPVAPDSVGPVAWGHAFGSWGSFDGDGNAAAMDTSTGGFLVGIDGEIASDIRLGFLTGYSHSTFDVDGRSSSGSSDNYHLGLYAGGKWDALRLTGGLAYTWHDIETGRSVAFPGFSDSLTGGYSAGTFQAFGEAGYKIGIAAASFEPFANLAYVSLHTDGFTEKGGDAALHVRGETTEMTFTTLGIHLSSAFDLGGMRATARGTLGWRHAFGDVTPLSTHVFAGGDPFDIAGVPIAEDAALVQAGLDLNLTEAATLGIAYQGQFASHSRQHGFNARLNVIF